MNSFRISYVSNSSNNNIKYFTSRESESYNSIDINKNLTSDEKKIEKTVSKIISEIPISHSIHKKNENKINENINYSNSMSDTNEKQESESIKNYSLQNNISHIKSSNENKKYSDNKEYSLNEKTNKSNESLNKKSTQEDLDFVFSNISSLKISSNQNSLINSTNNNIKNKALNGMSKIIKFIRDNQTNEKEFFFSIFNKNCDNLFDMNTFYNKLKNYIKDLNKEEVNEIFNIIDVNKQKKISYKQVMNFYIQNKNNKNFINPMNKILSEIFDKYDKNKKGIITLEDFIECLNYFDKKITYYQKILFVQNYFGSKNIDSISKEDFINIMLNFIENNLYNQKLEKDKIKMLFKKFSQDGFLNGNQLRFILKNKLKTNLNEEEIDKLCDSIAEEYDDLIECGVFIQFIENLNLNNNSLIDQNTELSNLINNNFRFNTFSKIKYKSKKSILEVYPLLFNPSILREEQRKLNLLLSSTLVKKKEINGIYYYKDIKPIKNNNNNELILKPISTKINCKIYFEGEIEIPISQLKLFNEKKSELKICKKLLKIGLYNKKKKKFIVNSISIECNFEENNLQKWIFNENFLNINNNNIIIRYNKNNIDDIYLIFEFVLIIQKNENDYLNDDTIEITCSNSTISLKHLVHSNKYKLKINGGTIFKPEKIKENLFFSFQNKTFEHLNKNDQSNINFLPQNIICYRSGIHIISYFRKIISKYILNKYNQNINSLINSFSKIIDCYDAFNIYIYFWKEILIDGKKLNEKNFFNFNNRINSVLFTEKFEYDEKDPTKFIVDKNIVNNRLNLIKSNLKFDNELKISQLHYEPIYTISNITPFSINQINKNSLNYTQKYKILTPFIDLKNDFS